MSALIRTRLLNLLAILVLLALGLSAAPARAGTASVAGAAAGSLYLRASTDGEPLPALRVATRYDVQVTGTVARVSLEQSFTNPTEDWLEGLYVFPLSARSAVDTLEMIVGDRTIRGEIRPREVAKATYEAARAAGQRASLVDQQRPNMFRTSVANIAPHATITIRIAYQESLEFRDARYQLTLPLTITPRYTPGGHEATPEQVAVGAPAQTAAIQVALAPGFALDHVRSVNHAVDLSGRGAARRVNLRETHVPADRDFILEWAPGLGAEPAAAAFVERHGTEGYTLLTLTPPDVATEHGRPREVMFVIDTSGSMGGPSIEQARAALALGIDRLTPRDRFNIIRFSSDASRLFATPRTVDDDSLSRARRFIAGLRADGGTEMRAALDLVFDSPAPEDALRQIVFITDGSVSNEAELVALIEDRLGGARLFTVGIGAAPNEYFLREAAAAGRGSFTFISDVNDVRARMEDLFRKLERPALVGLSITWPDGRALDPAVPLPADLYAGDPLTIVTHGANVPTGLLTIEGTLAGTPWSRQVLLTDVDVKSGVGKLWARERIERLMRLKRLGGDGADLDRQILGLAMTHHLVSEQTSLVAVDQTPARPASASYGTQRAPTSAPVGSAWAQVAGMPVTATPAPLLSVIAAVLLTLALILVLL